jgi:hypothetical protein
VVSEAPRWLENRPEAWESLTEIVDGHARLGHVPGVAIGDDPTPRRSADRSRSEIPGVCSQLARHAETRHLRWIRWGGAARLVEDDLRARRPRRAGVNFRDAH